MKRDMDLIRELLAQIEETDKVPDCSRPTTDDAPRIFYHVALLLEAGLVTGFEIEELGDCIAHMAVTGRPRLTWSGHEFMDAARSDTIWNAAKNRISGAVGAVSFPVLTHLLSKLAEEQLGM